MKVSDSIRTFLQAERQTHNGPDLLDFYLANPGLETQVNVAAGDGWPVEGKRSTYTDGLNDWWAIRIPKKADSDPEWNDYPLKWPLELHAEGIGSTGWNWQTRRSLYVGFDFDSIVGHAAGVGITDERLEAVRQAAQALPWVEVRRSTGGGGLHLYAKFEGDGIPTENHTEHAALARCVLGLMSAETGFDFAASIDACGGNMWLWHRKSTPDNHGLALIKAGQPLPTSKIPANWKDHVDVVTRRRTRTRVNGVPDEELDAWDQLSSAHRITPLDDHHKAHIDAMQQRGFAAFWDSDRHLLQAHTLGFKRLTELEEFKIYGVYDTTAPGKHPGEANCFAFPGPGGSWKIYRFSKGVAEAACWEQTNDGYTTCWFNRNPSFKVAARFLGGAECKGGYEFPTLTQAIEVAKLLGKAAPIEVADEFKNRKAVISETKDGRLSFQVAKASDDSTTVDGWNSTDKKNFWTCYHDVSGGANKDDTINYDGMVRCLKTPDGKSAGWAVKEKNGVWKYASAGSVKTVFQSYGLDKEGAEILMGKAELEPWTLVQKPFKPEEPGNREWNRGAPQLRYQPLSRYDEATHPHWDMIFTHLGRDLDPYVRELEWAKKVNIRTGADYLRTWLACILKDPECRLPYLFFFGGENCGKSIFWESIDLLLTCGVVKADRALTNQSDFNGELAGAVLCVVEEKDISKTPGALAKIKDTVTSPTLSIRKMRMDSYQIPNLTHWVQTANHQDACVVPPGDTRIVVIHVRPLEKEIPKPALMEKLKEEAPAFLRTLTELQPPTALGRLALPVVATAHKARSEDFNRSALDMFIRDTCFYVPGEMILFKDFYEKFVESLPAEEVHGWTRKKVSINLPIEHPSGAYTGNQRFVGNLSWIKKEPEADSRPWVNVGGKLVRDNG